MVAPSSGVRGRWARGWLASRSAAGLDAAADGTLIPAMKGETSWHQVAFTTGEFAEAFRFVLRKAGFTEDTLNNIGAHSLKTTCLSWVAKFGLERDVRRPHWLPRSAG